MDPELSPAQLGELREDLTVWIQRVIAHHGMEAALVLYPEQAQERATEFLNQVGQIGFEFLPRREKQVSAVREKALYFFLHNPTSAQRAYMANLMATVYLAAIFMIDPAAHQVVKQLTKGQRIYLDTNLVYDVLNLSGPRKYMTIRRVLEHTRKLGYEICVTPWTVAEMKFSVKKAREELAKSVLPPRALADLAAEACGDQGFVSAYWRKYKETGVKPDDFLDFHEQIDGLLEQADICIEHEGCIAVDRDEKGLAAQVGLLATVPGGSTKPVPVLEHDAKHRLLVERLRGSGDRRFSNAGYWFLTGDSVLVPYATEQRSSASELPFCVSLVSWTHIVRSLSPRTEDYEQTLVDLLDTPSVRPRGMVDAATVAEILGRIDMLTKDSTEEIATRMLLDQAVMGEAERRSGDSRERFIRHAVEEKSSELERELRETKAAAERERKAREASELRSVKQDQELARERKVRGEAEARARKAEEDGRQEADRLAREAQKRLQEEREHATTRNAEVEGLSQRLASQEDAVKKQERIIRHLVAALIGLLAIAIVAVPIAVGWTTGGWSMVGVICAGLAVAFAAVAWLYGRKRATAVATIVGLIISLASGIGTMVPDGSSSAQKSSHAPVSK
jgi:hypothetical protein